MRPPCPSQRREKLILSTNRCKTQIDNQLTEHLGSLLCCVEVKITFGILVAQIELMAGIKNLVGSVKWNCKGLYAIPRNLIPFDELLELRRFHNR